MTRSVINAMIAAAVLSTGVGLGAVPAAAEPGEPGVVNERAGTESPGGTTTDTATTGDATTGDATASTGSYGPGRRPPRAGRQIRPDRRQAWPWPCYEWGCIWYKNRNRRSDGIAGIQAAVPPGARTSQLLPVAPVAETEPLLDVAALQAQAPQALPPPAAATVAPPQSVSPAAVAPRAPVRAVPTAPVRSLPPPPAAAPAIALAPPPPQAPVAEPADSLRLGYPEDLRNADFQHLVSLALPGLAAIAGMTALGGMFGYRQAKAGYVLRTAGAGRFLQS